MEQPRFRVISAAKTLRDSPTVEEHDEEPGSWCQQRLSHHLHPHRAQSRPRVTRLRNPGEHDDSGECLEMLSKYPTVTYLSDYGTILNIIFSTYSQMNRILSSRFALFCSAKSTSCNRQFEQNALAILLIIFIYLLEVCSAVG